MKKHFETLLITRNNLLKAIENLSEEQLNKIPEGFNNNIIWNVAHTLVTQQLLCYKLGNQEMSLDESFVDLFKKGTQPKHHVSQEEIDIIKEELLVLAKKMEEDYNSGLFKNYMSYTTSYNITLNTIEEAIQFNNVHEGLHLGYIMAMKKML